MASIKIQIPSAFEARLGTSGERSLVAVSISDAIAQLTVEIPRLGQVIFAPNGRLHGFINLYLNDRDIRDLDGLDTHLQEGDCVAIVPAVAGG